MSTVRDLLDEARGPLPPVGVDLDAIATRGRKVVRRRRWATAGGSALLVAVIAAAGSALVRPSAAPTPPVAASASAAASATPVSGQFVYTYAAYQVGKYRVDDPSEVNPGYQMSYLHRENSPGTIPPTANVGTVTVYRPGAYDPTGFRKLTPVTIAGHKGYAGLVDAKTSSFVGAFHSTALMPAVAWEYASGTWAVVQSDEHGDVSIADARKVATAFPGNASRVQAGTRATVPYRVGGLPPGYRLVSVGNDDKDSTEAGMLGDLSRSIYWPEPVKFTGLTGPVIHGSPVGGSIGALQISVTRQVLARFPQRECLSEDGVATCRGDIPGTNYYQQVIDGSKHLSVAQVRAVFNATILADPDKRGTWYPAS